MTDAPVALRAPEVRTYTEFEIRDVDGTASGSYMEGLAVPYDTWADVGWFMEQHAQGSFSRSIKEAARGLPLLLWHDNETFPVGVSEEWRETTDGLVGVWRMDQTDELARTAVEKAKGGFLTGLSIGFAPIQLDTDVDDKGLMWVTRLESRLLEVSLTPTPAFAGAQVSYVRSRVPHQAKRSSELDAWRDYLKGVKNR